MTPSPYQIAIIHGLSDWVRYSSNHFISNKALYKPANTHGEREQLNNLINFLFIHGYITKALDFKQGSGYHIKREIVSIRWRLH